LNTIPKLHRNLFLNIFKKNLATSKNYLHLCTANKNLKRYMLRKQLHIEAAKRFSPNSGYTDCGACTTDE
jgi:hypothetical protein